ncbi:hypothetical protein CBER1_08263 [Cercospora berteroae]|uniref:AAA+ ATPase domain-containing protein n=1 Tax=Cercospora berteroae TaxID=357750 RepID=A0A2S6CEV8_9PEZI|nr:hypothetical protein CBER1_08263 [Cercospora berteroae]
MASKEGSVSGRDDPKGSTPNPFLPLAAQPAFYPHAAPTGPYYPSPAPYHYPAPGAPSYAAYPGPMLQHNFQAYDAFGYPPYGRAEWHFQNQPPGAPAGTAPTYSVHPGSQTQNPSVKEHVSSDVNSTAGGAAPRSSGREAHLLTSLHKAARGKDRSAKEDQLPRAPSIEGPSNATMRRKVTHQWKQPWSNSKPPRPTSGRESRQDDILDHVYVPATPERSLSVSSQYKHLYRPTGRVEAQSMDHAAMQPSHGEQEIEKVTNVAKEASTNAPAPHGPLPEHPPNPFIVPIHNQPRGAISTELTGEDAPGELDQLDRAEGESTSDIRPMTGVRQNSWGFLQRDDSPHYVPARAESTPGSQQSDIDHPNFSDLASKGNKRDQDSVLELDTLSGRENGISHTQSHKLPLCGSSQPQDSNHRGRPLSRLSPQEDKVALLETEMAILKAKLSVLDPNGSIYARRKIPWAILHRVECSMYNEGQKTYLDEPVWTMEGKHYHLESRQKIASESDWEREQVNVPFVVYLGYSCSTYDKERAGLSTSNRESRPGELKGPNTRSGKKKNPLAERIPTTIDEEVRILDHSLLRSLDNIFSQSSHLELYRPKSFLKNRTLKPPYLVNYHFRTLLQEYSTTLAVHLRPRYDLFLDYIKRQSEPEETTATNLFKQGLFRPRFMPYLFLPGELILHSQEETGAIVSTQLGLIRNVKGRMWACETEVTTFNGHFKPRERVLTVKLDTDEDRDLKIRALPEYPVKYADPALVSKLLNRGRFFFNCRNGRYLMGPGPSSRDIDKSQTRYMVDARTFTLIHDDESNQDEDTSSDSDWIEPSDKQLLCLPSTIQGFHMQDKKWVTLNIDALGLVEWNEDAFTTLAVEESTKELIQAVVENKIDTERGTDLMAGKGNGLILLLHGGPGTGKTLTAESVAEIAKKPLYRVTCGDIGTKPEEVEDYLDSVFYLAARWGCVVLLDEADVFLEQRTTTQLERNVLVSVFLRVLEYYDGILILTSNRVGTFDEAFKSRIQLAIHYEPLTTGQRRQIWGNFIGRLEQLAEDMDGEGIKKRLDHLSTVALNGRQIRNIITTSRQLAKFKKQKLSTEHLERAIAETMKFERYLLEVKDQVNDEDLMRDEGVR